MYLTTFGERSYPSHPNASSVCYFVYMYLVPGQHILPLTYITSLNKNCQHLAQILGRCAISIRTAFNPKAVTEVERPRLAQNLSHILLEVHVTHDCRIHKIPWASCACDKKSMTTLVRTFNWRNCDACALGYKRTTVHALMCFLNGPFYPLSSGLPYTTVVRVIRQLSRSSDE